MVPKGVGGFYQHSLCYGFYEWGGCIWPGFVQGTRQGSLSREYDKAYPQSPCAQLVYHALALKYSLYRWFGAEVYSIWVHGPSGLVYSEEEGPPVC